MRVGIEYALECPQTVAERHLGNKQPMASIAP